MGAGRFSRSAIAFFAGVVLVGSTLPTNAQLKDDVNVGGVAVNVQGNNNRVTVNLNDPQVRQILEALKRQNKKNEAADRNVADLQRQVALLTAVVEQVQRARSPEATPADKQAVTALEAGNTQPTSTLLAEREQAAVQLAKRSDSQATKVRAEAAELARQQGALAFERNSAEALAAYRRAISYEPEDTRSMFFIGDLEQEQGRSLNALAAYRQGQAIAQKLAASDPNNTEWQRDLRDSHTKIGHTQSAQGDLGGALKSFQASMVIAQKLAASDPSNTEWQRDLSVSHNNIGLTQRQQGDLGGALKSFQAGMVIVQKLVAADPSNIGLNYYLSIFYDRITSTQTANRDLLGALESNQAGVAIRQAMAAAHPRSPEWQRDMGMSHLKLGDLEAALKSFQAELAAAQKRLDLVKQANLFPPPTVWRRSVSLIHDRIGLTQREQGDLGGALKSFQASMAIAQELAASDPSNTEWQRDLSVSYNDIGETQVAQGDLVSALKSYQMGIAIRQKLASADPSNVAWQRDIGMSYTRIGDTQRAQGNLGGALNSFEASLVILQKVAASDPSNTEWQTDVAVSLGKLGMLAAVSAAERRQYLQRGLDILERLAKDDRLADARDSRGWFKYQIGKL